MLFLVSGGDSHVARNYMVAAQERRAEPLPAWLLHRVQQIFHSVAVSDAQTCATMAAVYRDKGVTLDPHSAVGVWAARQTHVQAALLRNDAAGPTNPAPVCVVLTAHPAKFDDACRKANIPTATCDKVERLKALPHAFLWLRAPPPGTARTEKLAMWAAAVKEAVETEAHRRTAATHGAAGSVAVPRARL